MERAKYNAKVCKTLILNETEITDENKILSHQADYYSELYRSNPDIHFNLENIEEITIPPNTCSDSPFSLTEITMALKALNNNKMPGLDGISADYYKMFWKHLSEAFVQMVDKTFDNYHMDNTMKQGVLNLIPKQGKDARYLKNLRPITVLNTDYKIVEKCISNRLKPCLDSIINCDQAGFMSNRRISANIRKLQDIMYLAKEEDEEYIILSCDFVKCFDRCEFACVKGSLKYFNFPQTLIDWVDILYNDFTVKVQNNGYFSDPIQVTRSIHQGGCCSAELFIICAELLAIMLRRSNVIEGVNLNHILYLLN